MRNTRNKVEVLVVGSGMAGASAAYHLRKLGVEKLVLLTKEPSSSATAISAGVVTGGQRDSFNRVSHAHGLSFARELWRFGDRAFDELMGYAERHSIPYARSQRLRLATNKYELLELQIASDQMQSAGFQIQLEKRPSLPNDGLWAELGERVLAIQEEGNRGGSIDAKAVVQSLLKNADVIPDNRSLSSLLRDDSGDIVAELQDGSRIQAEFLLLACHLAIGDFLPDLAPALVSTTEQWGCLPTSGTRGALSQSGLVATWYHDYHWLSVAHNDRLAVGGGRFLRKHAGIGTGERSVLEKIERHLAEEVTSVFPASTQDKVVDSVAGLDCRPCDELPIIGPMFGMERVLVATGFMGSGLTIGFAAGRVLADLIVTGQSSEFPDRLLPRRLRSL